jgi:ribose 1,5-bisphosphate isomerase
MTETVQLISEKIKRLEVQGARNVAIAAIQALQSLTKETKAKTKTQFLSELSKAQDLLYTSRETEPLMRNAIKLIIAQAQESTKEHVDALSQVIISSSDQFLKNLETSRERVAEIGSKRIRDGCVVFTHCHSSTVTRMLAKAKKEGKNFKVVCTETRPAFQGRITAKEMLDLDIETTFIVDSAAQSFMANVDLVVVGADAITSEGNVINKIGTSSIAVVASEARKPFYVVSELLKFNPATLYGEYEIIEHRSPTEIWKEAPEKLQIQNPAFDVTRHEYIHGLICEKGIIPPQSIVEVILRNYPWVFK